MRFFILAFLLFFSCIEERNFYKDIKLTNTLEFINLDAIPQWLTDEHKRWMSQDSTESMIDDRKEIHLPISHPLIKKIKEDLSDRLDISAIKISVEGGNKKIFHGI